MASATRVAEFAARLDAARRAKQQEQAGGAAPAGAVADAGAPAAVEPTSWMQRPALPTQPRPAPPIPRPPPGPPTPPQPTAAALRRERSDVLLGVLRECWPAAFPPPEAAPVPLAIGIDMVLRQTLSAEAEAAGTVPVSWAVLRMTMARWTQQRGYQEALAAGGLRLGLDGQPDGDVTDRQRQQARAKLGGG